MKKEKIQLENFQVQSFVTELNKSGQKTIGGGYYKEKILSVDITCSDSLIMHNCNP